MWGLLFALLIPSLVQADPNEEEIDVTESIETDDSDDAEASSEEEGEAEDEATEEEGDPSDESEPFDSGEEEGDPSDESDPLDSGDVPENGDDSAPLQEPDPLQESDPLQEPDPLDEVQPFDEASDPIDAPESTDAPETRPDELEPSKIKAERQPNAPAALSVRPVPAVGAEAGPRTRTTVENTRGEPGGRIRVESFPWIAAPPFACDLDPSSPVAPFEAPSACPAESAATQSRPAARHDVARTELGIAEAPRAIFPEVRENLAPMEAGLCGTCPTKSAIQPWPWEAVFNPICAVDEMILTEPERGLSTPVQNLLYGGIATLVPSMGVRAGQRSSRARFALSWPWSLPIGPIMASSREDGPCQARVFDLRPLRLLLEPGLAFTAPVTFSIRPGAQAIFQRASWNFGIGAGLGSTLETTGPYGVRASVSPELLLNWGRCCGPGFLRLSLRYDLFFTGKEHHALTTHVGFSFY
ncbi:MAG: hypothetical protein LBM75_11445 [Myxococcales bacterium]|nr:hypothetical protein [Myxococcales bacterium]